MKEAKTTRQTAAVTVMLLIAMVTIGCSKDESLIEMATEAVPDNRETARLHREVAEGTKRLVEADAAMREQHAEMQEQIASRQDDLEQERKQIASQRLTVSRLGPLLKIGVVGVICIVTIGFCWLLLFGLKRDDSDQMLNELLIEDVISDQPRLLSQIWPADPDRLADDADATEQRTLPI